MAYCQLTDVFLHGRAAQMLHGSQASMRPLKISKIAMLKAAVTTISLQLRGSPWIGISTLELSHKKKKDK